MERLREELEMREIELDRRNEELLRNQIALEESRDSYIDLFEFAPVGYFVITHGGLIARANRTVAALLGIERAQLINRDVDSIIASGDRNRWQRHFVFAMAQAEQSALDLAFDHGNGALLQAHASCLRLVAADGTQSLRMAIVDIGPQLRAAGALRDRHALSSATLDAVPEEVAVLDRAGVIVAVNRAWRRFALENGIEPGKPAPFTEVGSNYLAACKASDDDSSVDGIAAREGIEAVLAGRVSEFHLEYPCDTPREQRWFQMSVTPLDLASGGAVVAHTDITRLKRAMTELSLAEQRLRLAKSAAGLGIDDRDIPTHTLNWSPRIREMWGFGPDQPISYPQVISCIHADDRPVVQAATDRAYDPAGNGEFGAEYRVIGCSDGRERWIAAQGKVLFRDGRPVRYIGTVKDVSERKRLELELRERRGAMELLVSQQVAGHTAAAIAHELNQPLISVSAYSEAALGLLQGGAKDTEKLARAIAGAAEQAQRAGKTLRELLHFIFKRETPSLPVDLNDVVREAINIAREGGYGDFRSVLELEPGLPPVLANRLHLGKILVNLLRNSCDVGGAVTIKVRTCAAGGMARVTVHDNGPGLDPTTADRIFDPFFTTKPEGVGLGLAISRALVDAHGGKLWADLETGQGGATFHLSLPFAA